MVQPAVRLLPTAAFPFSLKSAIVKAVAHLSIVTVESYALRELSDAEIQRVEKHVASCPECLDMLIGEIGWAAAMRSPTMAFIRKTVEANRKKRAEG
jgi:hypothetical protein